MKSCKTCKHLFAGRCQAGSILLEKDGEDCVWWKNKCGTCPASVQYKIKEKDLYTTKEERARWLEDFQAAIVYGHYLSKANNANADRIIRLVKDVEKLLGELR